MAERGGGRVSRNGGRGATPDAPKGGHGAAPDLPTRGHHARSEEPTGRQVVRAVGLFAAALVCAVGIACGTLRVASHGLPPVTKAMYPVDAQPAPRMPILDDRRAMELRDTLRLSEYAWVDRKAGIVRIPIERAMEWLIARDGAGKNDAADKRPQSTEPRGATEPQSAPAPQSRPAPVSPPPHAGAEGAEDAAPGRMEGSAPADPPAASGFAHQAGAVVDGRASVAFDARIGDALPLDTVLVDANGTQRALATYFGPARPAIVVFTWFGCTALCPTTIAALARTLDASGLRAGRDVEVVVVSIDAADTAAIAAARQAAYVRANDGAGGLARWHFLTGNVVSIDALTAAARYRARHDATTGEYAHAGGFIVANPDGRIADVAGGFAYRANDLRRAVLSAAARETASSALERALAVCAHAIAGGRRDASVMNAVRGIALLSAIGFAATGIVLRRRKAH